MNTPILPPLSLSLLDGKGSVVKTWPLTGKKNFRIGRGQGNDIVLNSTWVSRQHAMLQIEENGTVNALDLGSSNGTLVNGQRIFTPTPLRSGDLVQIGGKSTLTFLQNYTVGLPQDIAEDEQTVAFMTKTQVTVLICDIRQFTSLSEKIGDQKISEIIRRWSHSTNEMVANHHGRVDKFIGDAVMAIWAEGASLRHTVHLALICASRIATMTTELGRNIGDLPWPLTIGAALNTGEAVIGNIGVDGNRDYTVIGDTVNVAFRLEGLASELGKDILIGNDTAALLDQKLLATYFAPCSYQIKGKSAPVVAYGCTFEQLQTYLTHQQPAD
jgi:adenylate cyclase